uniref:Uncharacterized protein n=2 Tax=Oryza TaxID=4527 RepID=A0A0E0Q9H9_ORYRU
MSGRRRPATASASIQVSQLLQVFRIGKPDTSHLKSPQASHFVNDPEMQKMLLEACNQMEKLVLQAKQSPAAMQLLRDELIDLGVKLNAMVPEKELSQIEEFESYLGCSIPSQIEIHPPSDTRSRGKIKRIKGHHDKEPKQNKKRKKIERVPRKCKKCGHVGLHDSRNCPNKVTQQ